ncbi:SDR family NAD(P)-dependent oxidoreductase [bacterium]|nr:SDR family NAD(P)-dependent oxidoreductase [bacterium]
MDVAVITGASMGLGAEFARQLAARHHNLLLIARSEDKLTALAEELHHRHRVQVKVLALDLAEAGAARRVADYIEEQRLNPSWLVNNAGFGLVGPFESMPPERIHEMMMLNMVTLVELTRELLPAMRLNKHSRIINVASTAAFQPVPYFNLYAATKVFVLHFSEALQEELRESPVRVLALCPGPTPTNFHVAAGVDEKIFDKGQSAADVVRMGLRASDQHRAVLVCQRVWLTVLMRLVPRAVVRRAAGFVARQFLAGMKKA